MKFRKALRVKTWMLINISFSINKAEAWCLYRKQQLIKHEVLRCPFYLASDSMWRNAYNLSFTGFQAFNISL